MKAFAALICLLPAACGQTLSVADLLQKVAKTYSRITGYVMEITEMRSGHLLGFDSPSVARGRSIAF
jgi:hypothetical protein